MRRLVMVLAVAVLIPAGAGATGGVAPPPVSSTHEPLQVVSGRVFREVGGDLVEVADVVLFCLGCHSAGFAPDRTARAARTGAPTGHGFAVAGGDHPVSVQYPTANPGYHPPELLDTAILLVGGRVTCVACHAAEDAAHRLTVETRSSRLCLACHDR